VRLQASVEEAALIDDITFHDLRHDFGHVNADGTPSIQTTVRYTQVGREQVKIKLRQIRTIEGGT
jgi:integrase